MYLSYRLQEERNKNYTEKQMLSLLVGLGLLYNQQPMNEKLVEPMKLHRALGDYDVNELMRNVSIQFVQVINMRPVASGISFLNIWSNASFLFQTIILFLDSS